MWNFLLAIAVASCPLIFGEILNRVFGLKKEYARKLIHVLGSMASASLVLLIPQKQIAIIAAIFCVVLIVVRRYKLTPTLYEIKRHSYGDLFFPLGVLLAALTAPDAKSFVTIMLIVGFADTFASLVGQKWGKHKYKVFRSHKSIEGSLTFFIISIFILTFSTLFGEVAVVLIAVCLTLTEAFSGLGLDNLTIPLVFGCLMKLAV